MYTFNALKTYIQHGTSTINILCNPSFNRLNHLCIGCNVNEMKNNQLYNSYIENSKYYVVDSKMRVIYIYAANTKQIWNINIKSISILNDRKISYSFTLTMHIHKNDYIKENTYKYKFNEYKLIKTLISILYSSYIVNLKYDNNIDIKYVKITNFVMSPTFSISQFGDFLLDYRLKKHYHIYIKI